MDHGLWLCYENCIKLQKSKWAGHPFSLFYLVGWVVVRRVVSVALVAVVVGLLKPKPFQISSNLTLVASGTYKNDSPISPQSHRRYFVNCVIWFYFEKLLFKEHWLYEDYHSPYYTVLPAVFSLRWSSYPHGQGASCPVLSKFMCIVHLVLSIVALYCEFTRVKRIQINSIPIGFCSPLRGDITIIAVSGVANTKKWGKNCAGLWDKNRIKFFAANNNNSIKKKATN